jgi:hypothetical protein
MDAIRFHDEGRLRIKLIGQDALDQLSSLPATLRLGTQGRHLCAAFLPIGMKPGLAIFCQDGEMRIRNLAALVISSCKAIARYWTVRELCLSLHRA